MPCPLIGKMLDHQAYLGADILEQTTPASSQTQSLCYWADKATCACDSCCSIVCYQLACFSVLWHLTILQTSTEVLGVWTTTRSFPVQQDKPAFLQRQLSGRVKPKGGVDGAGGRLKGASITLRLPTWVRRQTLQRAGMLEESLSLSKRCAASACKR